MRITKTINFVANKRRAIALLILIILMSSINYIVIINSSKKQLDAHLKSKVNNTMEQMINEMNMDYERDMINLMYTSFDNSIRYSLFLNLDYQVRTACNNNIFKGNINNLVVADASGTIVHSSFPGLKVDDPCPVQIQNTEAFGQFYYDGIYEYYYYPVIIDSEVVGGVLTFSSLMRFHNIICQYLKDKELNLTYNLWEISDEGDIRLFSKQGMQPVFEDHPELEHRSLMAGAYYTDDNSDFLSINDNEDWNRNKSGILLQISVKDYKRLHKQAMDRAFKLAGHLSIFFVFFLLVLDKLLRVSIYRSVKMKLMLDNLRMQKHEFLRHINIVNGLLQHNEIEKLKQYVESITLNMSYSYDIGRILNPTIEILIKEKEAECMQKEVFLNFQTNTKLDDIRFEDFDLCTILGNLIDNSIEAVLKRDSCRKVDVEVTNQLGIYVFKITNNGPIITHKEMKKIFRKGYTTKSIHKGHGIGLTIVKKVVQKYRGNIEVDSSDTQTSFTVCLPE